MDIFVRISSGKDPPCQMWGEEFRNAYGKGSMPHLNDRMLLEEARVVLVRLLLVASFPSDGRSCECVGETEK